MTDVERENKYDVIVVSQMLLQEFLRCQPLGQDPISSESEARRPILEFLDL